MGSLQKSMAMLSLGGMLADLGNEERINGEK